MKRIVAVVLMFTMLLTNVVALAEESAIDKLSDFEREVYDALLIMLTDFYNPSEVRILEMDEYQDRSLWRESIEAGEDGYSTIAGPSTVVLRLSGTNKLGGKLNHYYKLALNDWLTNDGVYEGYIQMRQIFGLDEFLITCCALAGEYVELPDDYIMGESSFGKVITDTEIGNINRALKEHWSILGF